MGYPKLHGAIQKYGCGVNMVWCGCAWCEKSVVVMQHIWRKVDPCMLPYKTSVYQHPGRINDPVTNSDDVHPSGLTVKSRMRGLHPAAVTKIIITILAWL
jgi:hypothetical protein